MPSHELTIHHHCGGWQTILPSVGQSLTAAFPSLSASPTVDYLPLHLVEDTDPHLHLPDDYRLRDEAHRHPRRPRWDSDCDRCCPKNHNEDKCESADVVSLLQNLPW